MRFIKNILIKNGKKPTIPSKPQKLWLHIGHGKTGTTALQKHFQERVKKDKSVYYPTLGQLPSGAHSTLFPLDSDLVTPQVRSLLHKISNEIKVLPYNCTPVISSEHLCFINPVQIRYLSQVWQDHNVAIVYYIRRQDNLIESNFRWFQIARPNEFPDIKEFYRTQATAFDFKLRIQPWVNVFGAEAIHVRLYDKIRIPNIITDFEGLIGSQSQSQTVMPSFKGVRKSLTVEQTKKLMSYNKENNNKKKRALFIDNLYQMNEASNEETFITPEDREVIYETYYASNKKLAQRFLTKEEEKLLLTRP